MLHRQLWLDLGGGGGGTFPLSKFGELFRYVDHVKCILSCVQGAFYHCVNYIKMFHSVYKDEFNILWIM
jgi:hypothetical protein